ncbi:unnamed protein product, partial [marine sediment metagenome]
IYAFNTAYTESNLNAITEALLGQGKIPLNKPIHELTPRDLAKYCLNDAEITLNLTTFNHNLVLGLIIL